MSPREAVAIEVRAAEFASEWDDDVWLGGFVGLGTVSPEGQHAELIERDIAAGRDRYPRDLHDYLVGHLALCIATHRAEDDA